MNELKARNLAKKRLIELHELTTGKRYYQNVSDVKRTGVNKGSGVTTEFRNADNRLSVNFHQQMVDEKVSYLFTYPPIIDAGDTKVNEKITASLGAGYTRKMKDLAIDASNSGTGWIHYWIENNEFKYGVVPAEQIIPIYDASLEKKLIEVVRVYKSTETDDKLNEVQYYIVENWTDTELHKRKYKLGTDNAIESEDITHTLGSIPFIVFNNNSTATSDLRKYKDLVDLYDRVLSGYANDLEDIQQCIYIIENNGATDTGEFLSDLHRFKAINVETDENGNKGGVKTLSIDIPVEARNSLLDILKKQILESGMALQNDTESFGNASGVALKFFYRKLELKAGLMETEFRESLDELIKVILRFNGMSTDVDIKQVWTRNIINNDLETAQIATQSMGILPQKLVLQNHPWVDDVEDTEKLLEEEEKEKASMFDSYAESFHVGSDE